MSKPEAGDTVRVTIEGVLSAHQYGLFLTGFGTIPDDKYPEANVRVDVLKKAKRVYKVGDTLTGAELKAHQWKRGTIIETVFQEYVLLGDGYWTALRGRDEKYPFSTFAKDDFSSVFTIKHIG